MIDEVMFEIRELSGQQYVDRYHGDSSESESTVTRHVAHVGQVGPQLVPSH